MKESRKQAKERTIKMKQDRYNKKLKVYLNYDIMESESRQERQAAYNTN